MIAIWMRRDSGRFLGFSFAGPSPQVRKLILRWFDKAFPNY
jgi:hypothetical protein